VFSFGGFLLEHTKDHADGSPAGGPTKPHHPTGLYRGLHRIPDGFNIYRTKKSGLT